MGVNGAIVNRNGVLRIESELVAVDAWDLHRLCDQDLAGLEQAETIISAYNDTFFNFRRPDEALLSYRRFLDRKAGSRVLQITRQLAETGNKDHAIRLCLKVQDQFHNTPELFHQACTLLEDIQRM